MSRIILNMIVKNESANIRRCLASVKAHINGWCLVDTGSTDDTIKLVEETMHGLPGFIAQRPWKDFAHNRTEAMALAKQDIGDDDYLLFLDADDWLDFPNGFSWPDLTEDLYEGPIHYGSIHYRRPLLVRAGLPWRWDGVLHEFLCGPEHYSRGFLPHPVMIIGGKGKDQAHYRNDAKILEKALKQKDLSDFMRSRYTFYLAQSWRDGGCPTKAIDAYMERVDLGGWDEEVYVSKLEVARGEVAIKSSAACIISAYLDAWQFRPSRPEALGELARWCRMNSKNDLAYMFAAQLVEIRPSTDSLFVDPSWRAWRGADELAVAAYWIGHYDESMLLCDALLSPRARYALPDSERERVKKNLEFAAAKVRETKVVLAQA